MAKKAALNEESTMKVSSMLLVFYPEFTDFIVNLDQQAAGRQ